MLRGEGTAISCPQISISKLSSLGSNCFDTYDIHRVLNGVVGEWGCEIPCTAKHSKLLMLPTLTSYHSALTRTHCKKKFLWLRFCSRYKQNLFHFFFINYIFWNFIHEYIVLTSFPLIFLCPTPTSSPSSLSNS